MSMLVSCVLVEGAGAANNGAGGNGRLGLPPYLVLGVPGRGLPLRSARSYDELETDGGAGGRVQSVERAGLQGRNGEPGRDEYSGASTTEAVGGGMAGTRRRLEGGREGESSIPSYW